jgi:hypothetical protein
MASATKKTNKRREMKKISKIKNRSKKLERRKRANKGKGVLNS